MIVTKGKPERAGNIYNILGRKRVMSLVIDALIIAHVGEGGKRIADRMIAS